MEDSIYRLRHRDILTLCVMGLLFLGVLMVQSASMQVTGQLGFAWTDRGRWHLVYAILALATYFMVGHIDYSKFAIRNLRFNPIMWLVVIAAIACALVLVPGIGAEVNGARRWLRLGPVQFQPSEMGKWAVVFYLAYWLAYRPISLDRFFTGFLPTWIPIGVICVLIVTEDLGTAALIGFCTVAMMLAGGVKLWHLAIVLPPAIAGGVWSVMHKSYRLKRMTAFLDPWANPQGDGYHMIQSLLSFATGGVLGKGLGNGIQKLGYLPEDTTDFIFAVICEELGLFGAILTITLYLGIIYVAWQVMMRRHDTFGRLIAFGVGAMIGLQALINIAVATVSMPTKGLSLPLVSAGGSGLIITCAALGMLLSVARHRPATAQQQQHQDEAAWNLNSRALASAL